MKRPAPVWRFAVGRSRKAARLGAEVRRLRHDLTVANALAEHRAAQIADLESRCRRLNETLDFLVDCRAKAMDANG